MTFGEFLQKAAPFIRDILEEVVSSNAQKNDHEFGYGLQGIANLVGGSISKAARLKKSGILDKAIYQDGRKFSIDLTLAREILQAERHKLINHNDLSFNQKK